MNWFLKILEKHDEILLVEALQRKVWPGSELDIVPAHIIQTTIHNGGLLIGAFNQASSTEGKSANLEEALIGFVFGFPGFYITPDGPRLKHCSHMLGVDPKYRNQGLGFALKRAQWQMVRHQGIDRITWTYDPLLSPNAHLNISRLGAVCNTYYRNLYGDMRDELNAGLPSDRLQVDWWVNSTRVNRRLSRRARSLLRFNQLEEAEVKLLNPASPGERGWFHPQKADITFKTHKDPLVMVEIPADFQALRQADPVLANAWRTHIREVFESLFAQGYLITDFLHEHSLPERSFYILSYGEATL